MLSAIGKDAGGLLGGDGGGELTICNDKGESRSRGDGGVAGWSSMSIFSSLLLLSSYT